MPKKERSPKRIKIERRIEAALYWSASTLMAVLGLIITIVYFRKGVTQECIVLAVRI
jgi:hypothetical protein